MSENGQSENGNAPEKRVSTIQIHFDHETTCISVGCSEMSLALAQMMVDEAVRYLADQRRQAQVMQLKAKIDDRQHLENILGKGFRS